MRSIFACQTYSDVPSKGKVDGRCGHSHCFVNDDESTDAKLDVARFTPSRRAALAETHVFSQYGGSMDRLDSAHPEVFTQLPELRYEAAQSRRVGG